MKKPFPQVLKGAATATSNNIARTGTTGRRSKPITMPKMPWDDENDVDNQSSNVDSVGNKDGD